MSWHILPTCGHMVNYSSGVDVPELKRFATFLFYLVLKMTTVTFTDLIYVGLQYIIHTTPLSHKHDIVRC